MLPGSTLFLIVCAQQDFWPGGAWPLVDAATVMAAVIRVFRGQRPHPVRRDQRCAANP